MLSRRESERSQATSRREAEASDSAEVPSGAAESLRLIRGVERSTLTAFIVNRSETSG